MGGAKQGEAVKQTEKQTSKFPTKTTVDVCQGGQHLAAQARDHRTRIQSYKDIKILVIKKRRCISGTNRLWSEAVLDAPGLVLHRLSSSKGRLSWLNISGAPVYHVNINICVFFIFASISLSLH